ncbi:MAG: PilZ domain-containing protein [Pseudomonadota bacterium]
MREAVEGKAVATERRRHPRFQALERALVQVTGNGFVLPFHLIDISEGGMAFRYLNENPLPLTDSKMDLYLDHDLLVGRLPVTVVDDQRLSNGFIPKRRCSVRFGTLTPAQHIQLQSYIRCHVESVQSSPER